MKTVLVGGGPGCLAVLEMVIQQRLAVSRLEVIGVVDLDQDAPGIIFARKQGWPTFTKIEDALSQDGLELVVEVTGKDAVCEQIARLVPKKVRIMDHQMARVFWDLDNMASYLSDELKHKTALEAEIQKDRRRLQMILNSLPDAVMVLDKEGKIERVNRRFEEVTGVHWKTVKGIRCCDIYKKVGSNISCHVGTEGEPDEQNCPRKRVLKAGKSLTVVQQQSCIRGADSDEDSYYQITASQIPNASGNISIIVTSREVTEQIRLAQETEELARRARQILNAVDGIITITDLSGTIQFANPSAEQFFGIGIDQLEGKDISKLFSGDTQKIVQHNDQEIIRQADHLSHEENLVFKGKNIILITERILLLDYKGRPIGICRISRNITVARRMRDEMVESEKHAAVGKLAAGIAHELNNPLTGILTFSEDLLDDIPKESPAFDDVNLIMRETLRCRQLVRDLLDFTRKTVIDRQTISITKTVEKAVKLVEKQAAFHNIKFDLKLSDDKLYVPADPNQLQQVILNLIINARDAMDGKGRLTVISEGQTRARQVRLEVRDEGCGIPAENLDQIFDPFFSTKGDKGNGLGLASVRNIVEEHGGKVAVESRVGRGSTFCMTLRVTSPAKKRSSISSPPPAYHLWDDNR